MVSGDEIFDVAIVGGAIAGLSFALALRNSGLRVAVIERAALRVDSEEKTWDARIYSISPGSAVFLHELGVWQRIDAERLAPIETMRVAGDRPDAEISFSAYELGERALAWTVENRSLQNALVACIHRAAGSGDWLRIFAPALPRQIDYGEDGLAIGLEDGGMVRARLVVGADGANSWTRQAAGIAATPVSYGQRGVVANFDAQKCHYGCAYQWFLGEAGVLAWLPLPDKMISMVWSTPDSKAAELLEMPSERLADTVAGAGRHALGKLTGVGPALAFPLSYLRLPTPLATRIALIGDAAHSVHPLAGQGLNLGLADACVLGWVLRTRGPVNDCGADLLLQRFVRGRAEGVLAMQAVTDGLSRLFLARSPVTQWVRNTGLSAVNRLETLKRLFSQPALR